MRTIDFKGREAADLRSMFGDLPIVEAKSEMIVYVARADMDRGVRGDPANCMFSQACKRAFGSHAVLFYPTIAYVDMLDEDGNRIVMRFRVHPKAREAIEKFDRDESVREATFRLSPVGPKQTLAAVARRQRTRARALKNGERTVDPKRSESAKKERARRKQKSLIGMRTGSSYHPGRADD